MYLNTFDKNNRYTRKRSMKNITIEKNCNYKHNIDDFQNNKKKIKNECVLNSNKNKTKFRIASTFLNKKQ